MIAIIERTHCIHKFIRHDSKQSAILNSGSEKLQITSSLVKPHIAAYSLRKLILTNVLSIPNILIWVNLVIPVINTHLMQ